MKWTWILLCLGWGLAGLFGARLLLGCGGAEFQGLGPIPDAGDGGGVLLQVEDAGAGAGDAPPAAADAGDAHDPHPVMTSPDAGELARDVGPEIDAGEPVDVRIPPEPDAAPLPCEPDRCKACDPLTTGYACCSPAGACGCENPSQGGACR
jgi:hypothetical protein